MTWTPRIVSADGAHHADLPADPVFAAIENYRRCFRLCSAVGKTEPPHGHPDMADWTERNNAACEDEADAAEALAKTVPTTAAGVAAFVGYIRRTSSLREHHDFAWTAFYTLAKATRNLLGEAA